MAALADILDSKRTLLDLYYLCPRCGRDSWAFCTCEVPMAKTAVEQWVLVVAANYYEARTWAVAKGLSESEWCYVKQASDLSGKPGHVVELVGAWHRRPDAPAITRAISERRAVAMDSAG